MKGIVTRLNSVQIKPTEKNPSICSAAHGIRISLERTLFYRIFELRPRELLPCPPGIHKVTMPSGLSQSLGNRIIDNKIERLKKYHKISFIS